MILQAILFYLFAAAVGAGVMVVAARNPVHSVLFLILAFFNTAGLFILIGAEFLAMILVIVYVGAVAVLFLFVVMMLGIDFVELRSGFVRYLPIGGLVGLVLLAELILVSVSWAVTPAGTVVGAAALSNTRALGDILCTRYVFAFQAIIDAIGPRARRSERPWIATGPPPTPTTSRRSTRFTERMRCSSTRNRASASAAGATFRRLALFSRAESVLQCGGYSALPTSGSLN
jgi:NADH-quinone oxidoreductase subunit J